ncbi:hypothetical protein ACQCN2_03085 [Brevibacillus ginsengisoli]|uniref:hypothetical protein n=1 Tax=Brevibacillus ginsengisoli TaxID=363854 RepID=UPI003CF4E9F2
MNALQLVDKLQEAEYRITHLKLIIDHLSTEPDMKESINVLSMILKDYQIHYEKTRQTLGNMEVHLNLNQPNRNHQNHNQNQFQDQDQHRNQQQNQNQNSFQNPFQNQFQNQNQNQPQNQGQGQGQNH